MSAPAAVLDISPSIRSNSIWNVGGTIFYVGCQWALLSILARVGGTREVGVFTMALSVNVPIFVLGNLQLRAVHIADAKNTHAFEQYLCLRVITTVGALLVALGSAALMNAPMTVGSVMVAVSLYKAVESIADLHQGVFQKYERMDLLARSLVLKGAVSIVGFAIAYICTRALSWSCLALIGAHSVTLLLYDAPRSLALLPPTRKPCKWNRRFPTPTWSFVTARQIAGSALPLGITMLLISLQTSVPRLTIERYLGLEQLGAFAGIVSIPTVGSMIMTAIGGAAAARLAALASDRDFKAFRALLRKLIVIALAFGALSLSVSAAFGRDILGILYGAAYSPYATLLVWAMLGSCVSYIITMLGFAATALGQFKSQPIIVAVSTGVLFSSCALLIPSYGLIGAAGAMLISSCVCLVLYVRLVFRNTNDQTC